MRYDKGDYRPLVSETQQILPHSSPNVPEPPLEPEVAELNPTTVKWINAKLAVIHMPLPKRKTGMLPLFLLLSVSLLQVLPRLFPSCTNRSWWSNTVSPMAKANRNAEIINRGRDNGSGHIHRIVSTFTTSSKLRTSFIAVDAKLLPLSPRRGSVWFKLNHSLKIRVVNHDCGIWSSSPRILGGEGSVSNGSFSVNGGFSSSRGGETCVPGGVPLTLGRASGKFVLGTSFKGSSFSFEKKNN